MEIFQAPERRFNLNSQSERGVPFTHKENFPVLGCSSTRSQMSRLISRQKKQTKLSKGDMQGVMSEFVAATLMRHEAIEEARFNVDREKQR